MIDLLRKRIFNKKSLSSNDAFTLAELLVASAISAVVLSVAYSLTNVILTSNKNDNTNIGLNTKIENALDFVVDEVKSSKKVISDWSGIPQRCGKPAGEFVLGLLLPDQALTNDSYKIKNNVNWKKVDCPVVYTLQRDNSYQGRGGSYKLLRNGPQLDKKGFYIPTKISQTLISDRIRYQPDDIMPCDTSRGWTQRKVRGITICTAPYNKAAEIGISAETIIQGNKYSSLTKTSGAYARIQDEELVGDIGSSFFNFNKGGLYCSTPPCCTFGTCSSTSEQTFFIDVSGSMGWCRAKNKNCMEAAKEEVIRNIKGLSNGVKLQVVAFNSYSRYLWPSGPKSIDPNTRQQAIKFVSSLRAGGGTDPWNGLWNSIQNKDVTQIILISDGYTRNSGSCNGKRQKFADCFRDYNKNVREASGVDPVKIDSVSLGYDFCRSGQWMGELATKNNGKCNVIR